MLDITFGEANRSQGATELLNRLKAANPSGTLYIGYPVLSGADGQVQIDALLTCEEYGVVAFDLSGQGEMSDPEWCETLTKLHSDMYVGLESKLKEHRELRKGRNLAFQIATISLTPRLPDVDLPKEVQVCMPSGLIEILNEQPCIDPTLLRYVNSAIQTTSTMKPKKKRVNATRPESRGSILREIEKHIANLDRWQKRAAIEYPDGPQRIRGLAGSGKTIVLAQKAALLHAKHPDWNIVVTFNTRSLYQQFRSLIQRFHFEIARDDPDWTKLRILHAWGGSSSAGLYSEIARGNGRPAQDFSYAKDKYGAGRAFEGVCKEFLVEVPVEKAVPLYDIVLIDEAQDLPQKFFQLVYGAVKPPKRIVWAYDELQNLGEYTMPPAEVIFGRDKANKPRVKLQNKPDQPQQDIILPVCYRNTPWTLTVAHALGFGIYRSEGLVQMFDDVSLWREIGYEVLKGPLELGQKVSLARSETASPPFFKQLMRSADAVEVKLFADSDEEYGWVAERIKRNLEVDELEADDILVIVADPLAVKLRGSALMRALQAVGLSAHIAGITSSRDVMFYKDSISITSIYRAKGNEAPMVYVIGADACYRGLDLSRKRNMLFTAITRSRAWVHLSGSGANMARLSEEIEKVATKSFQLRFIYPTEDEIKKLTRIHRDRSDDEIASINRDVESVERLLGLVQSGEIAIESLPEKTQGILRASILQ